jgi:hypothetical protein
MRTPVTIFALVCVSALISGAYGQNESPAPPPVGAPAAAPQPPGDVGNPNIRELIEEVMAARLAKELALNDEQTVLLIRRVSEFRDEINTVRKQRQDLFKALKTGLRSGEPDTQIEGRLKELIAQDEKLAALKKAMYERASAGLPVAQRAKLYVFVNEFESDMRKLVQRARERTAQRGGRFAGPEPPQPGDNAQPRRIRRGPGEPLHPAPARPPRGQGSPAPEQP